MTNRLPDEWCFKYKYLILPVFAVLSFLKYYRCLPEAFFMVYYVAIALAWFSLARWIGVLMKFKIFKYLADRSFFVYAAHFLFIPVLGKVLGALKLSKVVGSGSLYSLVSGSIDVLLCLTICVILGVVACPVMKLLNGQGNFLRK